jgi:hypothetical protein
MIIAKSDAAKWEAGSTASRMDILTKNAPAHVAAIKESKQIGAVIIIIGI